MTFQELAARLGAWCWTERRLFEVIGGWASTSANAEVKLHFASICRHFADHAMWLWPLLPRAYAGATEELVAPPADRGWAATLTAMEQLHADVDRLAAAHLVAVPALLTSYQMFLDVGDPVADGPVLRAVRIIVTDLRDDLRAGEALLAEPPGGIKGMGPRARALASLANRQVKAPFLGNPFAEVRR